MGLHTGLRYTRLSRAARGTGAGVGGEAGSQNKPEVYAFSEDCRRFHQNTKTNKKLQTSLFITNLA